MYKVEKPIRPIGQLLVKFISLVSMLIFALFGSLCAQTPGLIYKPAASVLGRSVLDPNGDGFVSLTTAGFSGTDYGSASELNMVSLPILGIEPTGDLTTGASGGHTDIVNNGSSSNQSCYILYKSVGGVDYLIIRFRIGSASTSSKGYSFLLDTDGVFGSLLASGNPGFDKEVVLETGNSGKISIYNHSISGTTLANSYALDEYHQRSVALSTNSSNPDYFYDFFVPYSGLGLASQPVRISAVTVTSAGSGITGSKSDYNGINDQLYGNDPIAIANALINSFPSAPLTSLTDGYVYAASKSTAPVVNGGITTSSTSISGTSSEANGTVVTIYKNGVSIGTATVTGNVWTLSGVTGLTAGNLITAKATATDKTISDASAAIEVTAVAPCFTKPPVITLRTSTDAPGGTVGITGTWSGAVVPNGSNVVIKLYSQTLQNGTYSSIAALNNNTYYVKVDGTWQFVTTLSSNQLQTTNFFATATIISTACESGLSEVSKKTNGQTGTVTAAPTLVTTTILASASVARSVVVTNNDATAAILILYENGYEIARTASTIAAGANHTFSYTGFIEADSVFARAQSATTDYWLSNLSNKVVVSASAVQTTVPFISGTYIAGSSKTVSGTSTEAAGSTITLYKAGTTLLGTATVTAYGTWTISGLTLATSDVLTAYAKAAGKTLSAVSNAVTVAASAPGAPVITGSYQSGATSISGTGASGTVTVYVDGSAVGSVTVTGAWTLSGIAAGQLYKGGVITAVNTVSGISSVESNSVTIVGVNSFKITNTSDGTIGTQVAGVAFNVKFTAMDGLAGAGSLFSGFSGKVVVSSSSVSLTGTGQSSAFSSGVFTPHSMNLTTAGSGKTITIVSVDDPTAVGTATIAVIDPASVYKLVLNAPADVNPGTRAAYTVTRKDTYDNLVTTGGAKTVYLTASAVSGTFYDAASGGNQVTTIQIANAASSANFWFVSNTGGPFTITASDAITPDGNTGLQDATDEIIVGTIWTGNTSTDWGTNTNWEGNAVPGIGAEIVVPAGRINYPILDQNRAIGGIYLGTGATARLNAKVLTVQGAFSGTGKFIGDAGAGLVINGSGNAGTVIFDQTTPGTTNKVNTLLMDRASTGMLALGTNLNVGTLTLTNGKIEIGDYTLTSTTNGLGSANAYVKTSGTGRVKTNIASGTSIVFPVGNEAYNPVTISNNTGVADDFSVQVLDEVYVNGNGNGGNRNNVNAARVKRTWEISKGNPTANAGTGVDFIFDWNDGEEVSSLSSYAMYHYEGGNWGKQNGGTKHASRKEFTYTGYMGTFSPFTILEGNSTLPVQWKTFKAEKKDKQVLLTWETSAEQNTRNFTIQHSVNGQNWTNLGVVNAAGNSSIVKTYQFSHYMPSALENFYRILQMDLDGKQSYSAIQKVSMPTTANGIKILGNPVSNGQLKLYADVAGAVELLSVDGSAAFKGLMQQGITNINVAGFAKGTYILRANGQTRQVIVQ